jgi:1,2-diacylglycerol 3-beta-galactosyltransferase
MSARPWQWQLFYHITNTRFVEMLGNQHFRAFLSERVKERITNFSPDVVISVHPTMNKEPRRQCRIIGKELGKHIPFYTVVTDLGSAHQLWFDKGANKVFVASERLREIAKQRGFEDERIIMSGLPIRHGFAHQADKLGDRTCQKGKEYQKNVKKDVNINIQKPMVLVMGGGEGVGSLSEIVDQLYVKLTLQGVDATICVVCGRNETLKKDLESRDWEAVLIELFVSRRKRSPRNARPNRNPKIEESVQRFEETSTPLPESSPEGPLVKLIARLPGIQLKKFDLPETTGNVDVIGLGFISNMPEYMVAADVLVTKAGPGTIAEAASVGLPVMLTRYVVVC